MKKHNLLRNAVHFALTAGVATSFGSTAFAADEDVAEQDKITVTGSRIQRVDIGAKRARPAWSSATGLSGPSGRATTPGSGKSSPTRRTADRRTAVDRRMVRFKVWNV